MNDREGLEKLAQAGRRHSGTGTLVYGTDALDDKGCCWCSDCKEWIPADQWTLPCTSTQERRKRNRRALMW